MRNPVRFALLLVLLIATAAPFARAAGEPELEGMYAATGMNPDGNEYHGVVHIEHHGESLLLTWMFPDGPADAGAQILLRPQAVGIGILNNGMLAVSYHGPRMAGIVLYRIEADGKRLTGQWTLVGDDGTIRPETLEKLPDDAIKPRENRDNAEPETPRPPRPVRLPVGGQVESARIRTFRNFTTPAPYCSAIAPRECLSSCTSTVRVPFIVTVSRLP